MINFWTSEDIHKILIQLDAMQLPFPKYTLSRESGDLILLGQGGFSEVYEAQSRSSKKSPMALKVIGFKNDIPDSALFNASVQVQQDIGTIQENIIKIYDHTELWVTFDEKDNVVSAVKEKPQTTSKNTLKLQFVLMEKLSAVLTRTKAGNIKILPETLGMGDEQEILKFAYDIGLALKKAHNEKVLHRDVKLENVFYSEKKKIYKLGDFGISKKTEDGFAGTVAFTKGYAAPEVRSSANRYDNTADIYSFGMMLYVLANGLKFPNSNTYNVNAYLQYQPGYIVPKPEFPISEAFYSIIAKACMYDAEQRYQSMEEMLLEIEKLMYGANLGYKKEHKKSSLVVGTLMLAVGVAAWKLTIASELVITFSLWHYLFLATCFGKALLFIYKKSRIEISIVTAVLGIYLMIITGFSWIKLILLLWMTFSLGIGSGYFSMAVLIASLTSWLQQYGTISISYENGDGWVVATILSISAVLLYQYCLLILEDRKTFKAYYKRGYYWGWVLLMYTSLFLIGTLKNPTSEKAILTILGKKIGGWLFSSNLTMFGLSGLGFTIFWIIREKLLYLHQKHQTLNKK